MNANKKTLKLFGIAVASVLLVSGAYALLFSFIKDKTDATAVDSAQIDELSGRESRIASSILTIRNQSANMSKLSGYFFNVNDIVVFTKEIEDLGTQSGTTLTIESLDQGAVNNNMLSLDFRIKATGKFTDIDRLLKLLEDFPGTLQWKAINLSQTTMAGASSEWSAEIFLTALNFVNQ